MSVIGRLADGVTEEEARTQLTSIAARLTQQYPEANREIVPVVRSWMEVQTVGAEAKGLLYTMFVAVVGVLLIACANVANLLFAVTIARGKELAVRTAMGASRTRVLRQLLMESLVLAAGGGILGVVLSKLSLDVFTRIVMPLNPPPYVVFELSSTVIAFVIGITFVAALASGILPAIHATKVDVHSLLQDQSRGSSSRSVSRWSTGLVALEVALSCALLVGAGLMVRSTFAVGQDDFGLDREGLLTARLVLPGITYSDTLANAQVIDRMLVELAGVPGVSGSVPGSPVGEPPGSVKPDGSSPSPEVGTESAAPPHPTTARMVAPHTYERPLKFAFIGLPFPTLDEGSTRVARRRSRASATMAL